MLSSLRAEMNNMQRPIYHPNVIICIFHVICILMDLPATQVTHTVMACQINIKTRRDRWYEGFVCSTHTRVDVLPDSKVHGAIMGPTWGRQDPVGPHIGHINLAIWVVTCMHVNTLRPRQNVRHFAEDTCKCFFLNANVRIPIKKSLWGCVLSVYPFPLWWLIIVISKSEVWTITHCLGLGHETMVCAVCLSILLLKFVLKDPIDDIPALVQIMAWHRPGDMPLSVPMMGRLMTHIGITRGLNELTSRAHMLLTVKYYENWSEIVTFKNDKCTFEVWYSKHFINCNKL